MSQPNIILFMTDQQRFDTIGALGASHMITPNLDRLAREGTVFDNCFCTAPSCAPSRASFFNGQYPHSVGVLSNRNRWQHSWVEMLQKEGYHTVNIGKMHTNPHDAPCGFDQRFVVENKDRPMGLEHKHGNFYDEWDKFLSNSGVRKPSRENYKAEFPEYETALGAYEWPLEEMYHPDVFVGNMAKWFLEQRKSNNPLFMVVGFPGPHPPYDPPQRYIEKYKDTDMPIPDITDEELSKQPFPHAAYRKEMIQGNHDAIRWHEHPSEEQLQRLRKYYAANVTLIDEKIGEILEVLEKRGYLEDSIVIFTSDHGDCLGDHGHIQKWTMYDASTHVPMVVWSPNRFPAGLRNDSLIQHMDIAATLLESVGVAIPGHWEAKSLRPDLSQGREYVFAEHSRDNVLQEVTLMTMVRSKDHKLVHYLDQDWGELYDLNRDPGEQNNIWDDSTSEKLKNEMLGVIRDWRIRNSFYKI